MPFVIRHKATGEIVKMRSGKSVWEKSAHAKASFKTSGLDHNDRARFEYEPDPTKIGENGLPLRSKAWSFDNQDIFEIVETRTEQSEKFQEAILLLSKVLDASYPIDKLVSEIDAFLLENK